MATCQRSSGGPTSPEDRHTGGSVVRPGCLYLCDVFRFGALCPSPAGPQVTGTGEISPSDAPPHVSTSLSTIVVLPCPSSRVTQRFPSRCSVSPENLGAYRQGRGARNTPAAIEQYTRSAFCFQGQRYFLFGRRMIVGKDPYNKKENVFP